MADSSSDGSSFIKINDVSEHSSQGKLSPGTFLISTSPFEIFPNFKEKEEEGISVSSARKCIHEMRKSNDYSLINNNNNNRNINNNINHNNIDINGINNSKNIDTNNINNNTNKDINNINNKDINNVNNNTNKDINNNTNTDINSIDSKDNIDTKIIEHKLREINQIIKDNPQIFDRQQKYLDVTSRLLSCFKTALVQQVISSNNNNNNNNNPCTEVTRDKRNDDFFNRKTLEELKVTKQRLLLFIAEKDRELNCLKERYANLTNYATKMKSVYFRDVTKLKEELNENYNKKVAELEKCRRDLLKQLDREKWRGRKLEELNFLQSEQLKSFEFDLNNKNNNNASSKNSTRDSKQHGGSSRASIDKSTEIEILKQQVTTYKEDFDSERRDREKAQSMILDLQKQHEELTKTVQRLQSENEALRRAGNRDRTRWERSYHTPSTVTAIQTYRIPPSYDEIDGSNARRAGFKLTTNSTDTNSPDVRWLYTLE
ncbi:hypothetical protein HELRODRAFT_168721 [Helobdella robusta]|uniref:Uncharacterized protein n=1 Tax=Helobdella robusta TaxID=6412 RepID=T1F0W2_HELRO|nr:hypothetical protein HELRODRAFT_168721 [Helobdella robusta]ESO08812.1 hypothetical protein HELRODRAFT_168721 [Helobdella robusta]